MYSNFSKEKDKALSPQSAESKKDVRKEEKKSKKDDAQSKEKDRWGALRQ